MRSLILTTLSCITISTFAQKTVDVSKGSFNPATDFYVVGGTPFVNTKFVSLVEGTPYFKEDWMKGSVVDKSGYMYKNLTLKLDLYDNELHYQDKEGTEMIATTPLKEVFLYDNNNKAYHFVASDLISSEPMKRGYYLYLDSGSVRLYKRFHKELTETKPYGSATVEQRVITVGEYFIIRNNEVLQVKKMKDIPDLLSDKKTMLEEFLKNKDSKNASMDDRMTAVVNYYNSLLQSPAK